MLQPAVRLVPEHTSNQNSISKNFFPRLVENIYIVCLLPGLRSFSLLSHIFPSPKFCLSLLLSFVCYHFSFCLLLCATFPLCLSLSFFLYATKLLFLSVSLFFFCRSLLYSFFLSTCDRSLLTIVTLYILDLTSYRFELPLSCCTSIPFEYFSFHIPSWSRRNREGEDEELSQLSGKQYLSIPRGKSMQKLYSNFNI